MPTPRMKSRIALAVCGVIIAFIVAACASWLVMGDRAADLPSAGDGGAAIGEDGFAIVDWDYWESINPDIIGWVNIPGTNVDYPIMQAHAADAGFYLSHDVYGDWSIFGCPYLDCGDETEGLASQNCIIYGHNMGWDQSMFGDLEYYSEPDFASTHETIYIQGRGWKKTLHVQAADVIPGWTGAKRTSFSGKEDFLSWWEPLYAASSVRLASSPIYSPNFYTFCTCSYNFWSSERTLVFAE